LDNEVRVTQAMFDRYWREANADRLALLTEDELQVLGGFHWGLLLGARLDEETDRLLGVGDG